MRHILPSHMVKDPGVKARAATIHVRTKTSVGAKTCESLVLVITKFIYLFYYLFYIYT